MKTKIFVAMIIVFGMLMMTFSIPLLSSNQTSDTNLSSDDEVKSDVSTYVRNTLYKTDDGAPASYWGGTMSSLNGKAVVKMFKNVVVPANSDAIVWVWSTGAFDTAARPAGRGTDIKVTVGNMNITHTFTSTTHSDYIRSFTNVSDARWFKVRFYDADAFLSSGRIGINLTSSSSIDYCNLYYDATAETSGAQFWYWSGSGAPVWGNYSAWTIFVRLEFVTPDPTSTNYDARQIQFTSNIAVKSEYNTKTFCFQNSKEQLKDGHDTGASLFFSNGYVSGNRTVGNYINMTFHNRTIAVMGDSVMNGYPKHSPNPNVYGHADLWNYTPQYWLQQLLGQNILDESYPAQTTANMKARFEADVLAKHPDYVILHGGSNDIWVFNAPATTVIANLTEMINKCLENHTKVILGTLTMLNTFTVAQRIQWNATNAIIRTMGTDDIKIVDVAATMGDPTKPWRLNPLYDCGDGGHWNQIGNRAFANLTFQYGFNNVSSGSQNYTINKLVFYQNLYTTAYYGQMGTVNMSYKGGYEIITLANAQNSTFSMADVTTDFLNFSIESSQRLGATYAPSFVLVDEIAIYGHMPGSAPTIISTPSTTPITEGNSYSFSIEADQYIENGNYSIITNASWLSITDGGVVSGTSTITYSWNDSFYYINFTATNCNGVGYVNITLEILRTAYWNANFFRFTTTNYTTTIAANTHYSYQPLTNSTNATITVVTNATWLSFALGILSGNPVDSDNGTYYVRINATNETKTLHQNYTILVTTHPVITNSPSDILLMGSSYSFAIIPSQYIKPGNYSLITNASWLSITALGVVSGTPLDSFSWITLNYYVNFTILNVNGTGYRNITLHVLYADYWNNNHFIFTSSNNSTEIETLDDFVYIPTTNSTTSILSVSSTATWIYVSGGAIYGKPQKWDSGTFSINITATNGSKTIYLNLTLRVLPSKSISEDEIEMYVQYLGNGTYKFFVTYGGVAINETNRIFIQIIWNFGDGTNSTNYSITHTYVKSGLYTVSVSIRQNTDEQTMIVKKITIYGQTDEFSYIAYILLSGVVLISLGYFGLKFTKTRINRLLLICITIIGIVLFILSIKDLLFALF